MNDNNFRSQFSAWFCRQTYLPYRLRKSITKRISPKILSDYNFEIDFFGLKYKGNTSDNSEYLLFMFGACERYILSLMKDIHNASPNKDNFTFIDVGAHIGNHSLFMSRFAKKIYAFEPHPAIREKLQRQIDINDIYNIHLLPFGLSNENNQIPFYSTSSGKHLSSASFCKEHSNENDLVQNLEVKKGDDILKEQSITSIDIIKIDVEGFEKNVIEGLSDNISKFRPIIIAEISDTSRNLFANHVDFASIFPEDYNFYQFSGVHREKSGYMITEFNFDIHKNHLDVIALPKEKMHLINSKITSKFIKNKCIGG